MQQWLAPVIVLIAYVVTLYALATDDGRSGQPGGRARNRSPRRRSCSGESSGSAPRR